MGDESVARAGRNTAAFRRVNDEIATVAAAQGLDDGRAVPFICECSDPGCSEVLPLALAEYRDIRADPRRFVHAPGHEGTVVGSVRLVEEHPLYVVVERGPDR
jgi:hypothetical protein